MRSASRLLTVPGAALALVLGVIVAVQAVGASTLFATPTAVATVDISRVLAGLEQRATAESDLKAIADAVFEADEARKSRLEEMKTRLDGMTAAQAAARDELLDEYVLARLEHQEWRRVKFDQIDLEKSLFLRDLYRSIRTAISDLAAASGYDLVLLHDAKDEITVAADSKAPLEAQVKQQMMQQRILYAGPSIDVTDQLIERMNNAFSAGT